jgi:predicted membrane-bound spermidine synthase
MVDSADHFGACLGALLTGTLLVPILGLKVSCIFIGILNLTSVTLLVLNLGQERAVERIKREYRSQNPE